MPGVVVTAGDARLEHEVVFDGQARDQVELLKHQAETVTPQFRAAGIAEFGDRGIGQPDLAGIGGVQSGNQVQERALAAAGFTCERDALSRRDRQVHPAQHRDHFAGGAVALGQTRSREH